MGYVQNTCVCVLGWAGDRGMAGVNREQGHCVSKQYSVGWILVSWAGSEFQLDPESRGFQ